MFRPLTRRADHNKFTPAFPDTSIDLDEQRIGIEVFLAINVVASVFCADDATMIMAPHPVLGELIPCGGGDPVPLFKGKLLVGRRSHCDIQLQFPNISSHHCELEFVDGFWRVQDLGSSNGIKVNGERLDSKWLMPGDVLAIGKHRYEVHYSPPEGQRPPEDQEDLFSRGLLEKAGLERNRELPHRSSSGEPASEPPPSSQRTSPNDDEAMKWLSEL